MFANVECRDAGCGEALTDGPEGATRYFEIIYVREQDSTQEIRFYDEDGRLHPTLVLFKVKSMIFYDEFNKCYST